MNITTGTCLEAMPIDSEAAMSLQTRDRFYSYCQAVADASAVILPSALFQELLIDATGVKLPRRVFQLDSCLREVLARSDTESRGRVFVLPTAVKAKVADEIVSASRKQGIRTLCVSYDEVLADDGAIVSFRSTFGSAPIMLVRPTSTGALGDLHQELALSAARIGLIARGRASCSEMAEEEVLEDPTRAIFAQPGTCYELDLQPLVNFWTREVLPGLDAQSILEIALVAEVYRETAPHGYVEALRKPPRFVINPPNAAAPPREKPASTLALREGSSRWLADFAMVLPLGDAGRGMMAEMQKQCVQMEALVEDWGLRGWMPHKGSHDEIFARKQQLEILAAEHERRIANDAALLAERMDAIRNMDEMIIERDRTIASQDKMLQERWDAIQEMGQFIYEREQIIAKLKADLERSPTH